MIFEINEKNIEELKASFLSKETVLEEWKANPFAKYIVLQEKNEIIGYIYYSEIYERVEINQFEINKIHRNCGKGQMLLDYFIKHVDKDITLEVKEDNITAIHVDEKKGFQKKAIRKGYYNGIDGILMERKRI